MDVLSLVEICFIVLCWSINPHIKKHIMLKNRQVNYYFINSFVITSLILLMYTMFYFKGTFSPGSIERPSLSQCILILLSGSISVFSLLFCCTID